MIYNNPKSPRTAGGYSVETFEPAIIDQSNKKVSEDLVKMVFTEKAPRPTPTTNIIYPEKRQYRMISLPVQYNINYTPMPAVSLNYNTQLQNPIQIVNPSQNQRIIYKYDNVRNIYPLPMVKSLNNYGKSNPFIYQNLIVANNTISNPVVPINYNGGFIVQNIQPVFKSNSANVNPNPNPYPYPYVPVMQPRNIQTRIITGPQYEIKVYKKRLYN